MPKRHIDRQTGQPFTLQTTPELLKEVEDFSQSECRHESKSIRRVTVANGAIQFRWQCLCCGQKIGSALKKTAAPTDCEDEDIALSLQYQAHREQTLEDIYQKHIRKQKAEGDGYQARYLAYLASDEWTAKRLKVLKRAGGICEGCLEAEAIDVHHVTYDHVFDELLFELVALCKNCHFRSHRSESLTETEHENLPCLGCRHGSWTDETGSHCCQFDMPTGHALAKGGPCGPNASALEPLK